MHVSNLLEQFSIEWHKTKTKLWFCLILWPITKHTDNPVNQSNLEANTCRRNEARENVRKRVTICSGFTSDWLRK